MQQITDIAYQPIYILIYQICRYGLYRPILRCQPWYKISFLHVCPRVCLLISGQMAETLYVLHIDRKFGSLADFDNISDELEGHSLRSKVKVIRLKIKIFRV